MKKRTIRGLTIICIMVAMLVFAGCSGATEEIGTPTSPIAQDNGPGTVPDTGQDTIQDTSQDTIHEPPGELVLTGSAQKGPMQADSSVEIYELDESLNQTGTAFQTKIVNDAGQYSVPVNLDSRYIELFAKGYYYDEISGKASTSWLTLSAIADVESSTTLNINLLTTLAKPRILALIDSGLSFEDANAQAQEEVLNAFLITTEPTTAFDQMSILEYGDDNAVLLAVSSIMMEMAHLGNNNNGTLPATLSQLISDISMDLQDDGQIDTAGTPNLLLRQAVLKVDPADIREKLEYRFPEMEIPDFEWVMGMVEEARGPEQVKRYSLTITCTENCELFNSGEESFISSGDEVVMTIGEYGDISGSLLDGVFYFEGSGVEYRDRITFSFDVIPAILNNHHVILLISGEISESGEISGYFSESNGWYTYNECIENNWYSPDLPVGGILNHNSYSFSGGRGEITGHLLTE